MPGEFSQLINLHPQKQVRWSAALDITVQNSLGHTLSDSLSRIFKGQACFIQECSSKTFFLSQQAKQQVLRPDMFVTQPLRFLSRINQHTFPFVAQRKIH